MARARRGKDRLLGAVFSTSSITLLSADTGLGKTMVALGIAFAIALGRDFLHWRARRKARALFLDGEMPTDLIKERSLAACGWFGVEGRG